MRAEILDKWLEALESGDYAQTRGGLGVYNDASGPDAMCCLGVLCDVLLDFDDAPISLESRGDEVGIGFRDKEVGGYHASMPPKSVIRYIDASGFSEDREWDYSFHIADEESDCLEPFDERDEWVYLSLPALNDGGFTFSQIADVIRWAEPRKA